MVPQDLPSLVAMPEGVKAVSLFLAPDWEDPSGTWQSLVRAYFQAFSPADAISLVLPYDPQLDAVDAIEQALVALAAGAGRDVESIPDTLLHPVPREPELWREVAKNCSGILETQMPTSWIQENLVPILRTPSPKDLQAFFALTRPKDLSTYEDPKAYWNWRAGDLIQRYNHLDQWHEMKHYHQREAELVTSLVHRLGIQDVLVAGCGNGRQFKYLLPAVKHLEGFDLVPEMVQDAQKSFPQVPVHCFGLEDLSQRALNHEAILSSTVLQHIRPAELPPILASLANKATRLLIFVELIHVDAQASAAYNFAHDYPELMKAHPEWQLVFHETHFQTPQVTSAVMAWERHDATPDDPLLSRIQQLTHQQRQMVEAFIAVLEVNSDQTQSGV